MTVSIRPSIRVVPLLAACLLVALLVGCGGASPQTAWIGSVRSRGSDHIFVGDLDLDPSVDVALVERTASALACSVPDVHVTPAKHGFSRLAEGCGKSIVYDEVCRGEATEAAPGFEGRRAYLQTCRFVDLGADLGSQLAELDREYGWPITSDSFAVHIDELRKLVSLTRQGTTDLACPPNRIVVGFWPSGRTTVPVVGEPLLDLGPLAKTRGQELSRAVPLAEVPEHRDRFEETQVVVFEHRHEPERVLRKKRRAAVLALPS